MKQNRGKFRAAFNDFISQTKLDPKLFSKIHGVTSPFGNYKIKHVYENIILIGDAGGFLDPMFGEGIFYAHRTAQFAAYSIIQNLNHGTDIEAIYERLLRSEIYPEMDIAFMIKRFAFSTPVRHTNFFILRVLLRSFEKLLFEVINGVRSFKFFRKRLDLEQVLG